MFEFVMANWEAISAVLTALSALVVALVKLVKVTRWGQANLEALDVLTGAVEYLGASSVKERVKRFEKYVPSATASAIQESAGRADPKKPGLSSYTQILGPNPLPNKEQKQ